MTDEKHKMQPDTAHAKELLACLYKNMKMGADSLVNLLPKAQDAALREEMMRELNRYEELAHDVGNTLYRFGGEPKEEGFWTKLSAKMGMNMNTAADASVSHLAQMMIEGATMGITENIKLIREYENRPCSEHALTLAKETVRFLEDSVERLKKFL